MNKVSWRPKVIEKYLEKYYRNIETRTTYRAYLKMFFEEIDMEPDDFLKLDLKTIEDKIWEFIRCIEDRPKKTQVSAISSIKMFLLRQDIEIKYRVWDDMKSRNQLKRAIVPLARKKTPTQHDLKRILSHSNLKGKTLFTLCASSGLRIDEALALNFNNIEMESRKITVTEEIAKQGIPRVTFCSLETQELLAEWFSERERLLQSNFRKSSFVRDKLKKKGYTQKKKIDYTDKKTGKKKGHWNVYKNGKLVSKEELLKMETRIFPFHYINAIKMWHRIIEKAGSPFNEKDTNPKLRVPKYHYNIHSLRRFFFTQLTSDRANEEFVNAMGGHSSNLDRSYKLFYEDERLHDEMKKEYDAHMKCLSIFEIPPDLTYINDSMKEKDSRIKKLENEMALFKLYFQGKQKKDESEKMKNKKN